MNRLIRDVAKEMCAAFYEACERSPRFRRDAPKREQFVRSHWPKYVPQARTTLAVMLRSPGRSEKEKSDIYDALLDDQKHKTRMESADQRWDERRLTYDSTRVLLEFDGTVN